VLDYYSTGLEKVGGYSRHYKFVKDKPFPIPPLEEQHRIVAKIEEILPYVDRYAEAYEKLEHLNAKFPDDMKKSILQYAIQGKLVEQRPEEGTAEELLNDITIDKETLINEGKIPKEKKLPVVSDDEKEFEIPSTWMYVRVQDIASYITDYVANGSFATLKKNTLYNFVLGGDKNAKRLILVKS
jgi:type I restriction enzyme S subunit